MNKHFLRFVIVVALAIAGWVFYQNMDVRALDNPVPYPSNLTGFATSTGYEGLGFFLVFSSQVEIAGSGQATFIRRFGEDSDEIHYVGTFAQTGSNSISVNSGQALPNTLEADTNYYVTVTANLIRDVNNSSDYWQGIDTYGPWTFTTAPWPDFDTEPSTNSTSTEPITELRMVYGSSTPENSINLFHGDKSFSVKRVSDDQIVDSFVANDPNIGFSADGRVVTFGLHAPLQDGSYYVTIDEFLFSDETTGLLSPRFREPTFWTFAVDTTPEEEEEEPVVEIEDTGSRRSGNRSTRSGDSAVQPIQDYISLPGVSANCPRFVEFVFPSMVTPTVMGIVSFLNQTQGESLVLTDLYSGEVVDAVRRFQAKYASYILEPLGLDTPTGNWHLMTTGMANRLLGCTR